MTDEDVKTLCEIIKANNKALASWKKEYDKLHEEKEQLRKERDELQATRIAYASEFDGDVGSIHQNIRELKQKLKQLDDVMSKF